MIYTPHAFVKLADDKKGALVFDLGDPQQRQDFLIEIVEGHDWNWGCQPTVPMITVEIHPMPAGWVETLPEHGGW